MRLPYNKGLKRFARELRKNMTDAERRVWMRIRMKQLKGFQFYRQKNIGNYIVDFYCPAAKLIVEIDGGQHYSEEGFRKDKDRDSYLTSLGLRILRFSDREVFESIEGVLRQSVSICDEKSSCMQTFKAKIPLYPPLQKGDSNPSFTKEDISTPPLLKGGFPNPPFAKGGYGGILINA